MSTSNQELAKTSPPKSQLQIIKDNLFSKGAIQLFKDNLPNAMGKQAEEMALRFAKMTYTAICQNPLLQQCEPGSLVKSSAQSASLGLDIDARGFAYLIPYRNNKNNTMEAQFQIGYMGLVELAYRSQKVKAISAHCIYESEKGVVEISRIDGQFSVKHPFSYDPPTGKMIAVYATAIIEGLGAHTYILRIDEIEKFRKISKAPNSPAWTSHYEAMCKKTAIRQLAKFLPKSILEDFSRGSAIDEKETFVEAEAAASEYIDLSAGSKPIDADFENNDDAIAEEIKKAKPDAALKAKAKAQIDALKNTEKTEPAKEPEPAAPPQKLPYYCPGCDNEMNYQKGNKCPTCKTALVKQ